MVDFDTLQEIHAKIMSLQFDDCKVYISNVDSQSSAEGGIIVQVIGEMSNANGPWRKFAQTFFLAGQHNGYFVLNDICRYIKEEGDEGTESFLPARPATPAEAPASTLPPAASVESVLFDETNGTKRASHVQSPQPAKSSQPETRHEDTFTFHSDVLAPASLNGKEIETSGTQPEVGAQELAPQDAPRGAERESAHPAHPVESAETEREAPPQVEAEDRQDSTTAQAPSEPANAEPSPAEGTPPVQGNMTTGTNTAASTGEGAGAAASSPAAPSPAPAAPKSWASLAAAGSTKWGRVTSEAKGVSAAVPQARLPTDQDCTLPTSSCFLVVSAGCAEHRAHCAKCRGTGGCKPHARLH